MNSSLNRTFTRGEAADVLRLPLEAIDALVDGGRLQIEWKDGRELISAAAFEDLFRDGLVALYRAIAAAPPAADEQPAVEESEIAIEEQVEPEPEPAAIEAAQIEAPIPQIVEVPEKQKPDLRHSPRFIPRRQIDGVFNRVRFSVVQISGTGLRIRHHEALLAGDEGKVSFALLNPPRSFVFKGHVVWTSIARYGKDEETFWISGLRAMEHADRLAEAMDLLLESRQLERDRRAQQRSSSKVLMPPGGVDGASDEEIAEVIKVAHRFRADPYEATRWYARAKFALSDERVRKTAVSRLRNREEVLGIWEYLDRRVEIDKIAAVVSWMRKARPRASGA